MAPHESPPHDIIGDFWGIEACQTIPFKISTEYYLAPPFFTPDKLPYDKLPLGLRTFERNHAPFMESQIPR